MDFTQDDLYESFDRATFSRGIDYASRGRVRSIVQVDEDVLNTTVLGSGKQVYNQSITVGSGRRGVLIDGDCSCPVGFNCKHVVAALLAYIDQRETQAPTSNTDGSLPYAVSAWLQRVEQLAAPKPNPASAAAVKKPSKTNFRLIFVLMPENQGKRLSLLVCKARLRVSGDRASAAPVSDLYNLLSNPPSYLQPGDDYLIRLFIAMRSGSELYGGASAEPKGKVGAQLLHVLLEQKNLYWANSHVVLNSGLILTLTPGPARTGNLGWRKDGDASRLTWQFSDGEPIDFILPTVPPHYIDNLTIGELALEAAVGAIGLQDLQALVAQAPPLAEADAFAFSR